MQVQIVNGSSSENIFIDLTKPENDSPTSSGTPIPQNGSLKLNIKSGTSKLFVFDNSKSIIWGGIVPTNVKKSIIVYPEQKKVEYDGESLPNTLNSRENFSFMRPNRGFNLLWMLVIIFIILVIIFCGWFFLKKK
jgi:hypothetical protein